MRWSIILHKNLGLLERCRLFPVPLLEESGSRFGGCVSVHLQTEKVNQLIFNNTSPYQYHTSTLLVSKSEWRSMPIADPAIGPSIWSIKSHSSHQSITPLKNLSSDISWASLDVSTYVSCLVVVGFQLFLPFHVSEYYFDNNTGHCFTLHCNKLALP